MSADPSPIPGDPAAAEVTSTPAKKLGRAAPTNVGLGRRLVSGFGAQTLTMIVMVGERFLMVPLFLYAWGLTLFEDYSLMVAAAGLVRLIDFGMESYYSASLRLSFSSGRMEEFQRHIAIGMGIYLSIICVALLLSTAFLLLPVTSLLGLSGLSESNASLVFWVLTFNRLAFLPRAVVRPIYTAHGEFSRGENVFTLASIAQTAIAAGLLLMKVQPGPYNIVLTCTFFLTSWLPMIVDQRRRYPGLSYRPALPTLKELKTIFRRAGFYLVRDWGEVLISNGPVLLIGLLARQPGAILIFNASRVLIGLARQFTIQLAKSGGFEMSRQLAQRDRAGLISLYLSLGRSIGALTGIAAGFILVTAGPLIEVWTHGKAPYDPLIILAFLSGVLISGPAQNSIMLLHMSNVPRPLATASLVQLCLVSALMFVLVPRFGPLGAAVALGFSECMSAIWSHHAATVLLRLPQLRYAARAFGSELAGFALGCAVAVAVLSFHYPSNLWALAVFYLISSAAVSIPAFYLAVGPKQRRRLWTKLNLVPAKS
ncbi:MAG: hypothetical protein K0S81_1678 [Rhodospirillales bacterium]|jgi:O-antigen/teichoic acid export membrane protein|nr:hypothetical protein [Rhodospirillales bacterium]